MTPSLETPNQMAKYREEKMTYLNHSTRVCEGCRRQRSVMQFEKESSRCKQCVLRGIGR